MRIGRTLPPAAAPLSLNDLFGGLLGFVRGSRDVERFADSLRDTFQVRYCFLTSSGKAALTLILLALKKAHPGRDRVLIPAFCCYSVPSAIVRAGLKVSLCDIDRDDFDFNPSQLQEKLADPRLLCVIPVHLFGQPADIQRLRTLIHDPAVTIVEDAAQGMGGADEGGLLGTLGDVGIFSLGRGKALSTVEGGIVVTDREDLAGHLSECYDRFEQYPVLRTLKLVFYAVALWLLTRPGFFWLPKSLPCLRLGETLFEPDFPLLQFTGFQAGLARNWRVRLNRAQGIRRKWVNQWRQLLPHASFVSSKGIDQPLLRYPVKLSSAEAARKMIQLADQHGLGIALSYPDAIHRIPELAGEFPGEEYPEAVSAAQSIVTLPVHEYVNGHDREKILNLFDPECSMSIQENNRAEQGTNES